MTRRITREVQAQPTFEKRNKSIEEATLCDNDQRARNMQEYEVMLMNYILNSVTKDMGGV